MNRTRIPYLDYLRLMACLAVVFLHVSGQNWNDVPVNSGTWQVFNAYTSCVRWAVPVFVMISGALFLRKEHTVKSLFQGHILRLFVIYILWSVFYAFVTPLGQMIMGKNYTFSADVVLENIITGHYHMWFIPVFIGFYICTPIYSRIIKSPSVTRYALIIIAFFVFILPYLQLLARDFADGFFATLANSFISLAENAQIQLVSSYGGFFLLGYALSQFNPSRKKRIVIYIFGTLGLLATTLLSNAAAEKDLTPSTRYFQAYTPNVAVQAIAVFVWFKTHICDNCRWNTLVSKLSQYSLGVILVHPFVMRVLAGVGLDALFTYPWFSVPIVWIIVCVISFLIVFPLSKIPKLSRYVI